MMLAKFDRKRYPSTLSRDEGRCDETNQTDEVVMSPRQDLLCAPRMTPRTQRKRDLRASGEIRERSPDCWQSSVEVL